jgi:uncharacterized cupredoxin-like copper-binding protein
MARTVFLIATIVSAVVLTACGSGSGDGSTAGDEGAHGGGHAASDQIAEPVEGAPEVTINAVDIDFKPAKIELPAGEPVNVTVANDGNTLHDFTLEDADVHVNVEPGETKTTSLTVDEPGTYKAKCTVAGHEEAGMTIDVVVADKS